MKAGASYSCFITRFFVVIVFLIFAFLPTQGFSQSQRGCPDLPFVSDNIYPQGTFDVSTFNNGNGWGANGTSYNFWVSDPTLFSIDPYFFVAPYTGNQSFPMRVTVGHVSQYTTLLYILTTRPPYPNHWNYNQCVGNIIITPPPSPPHITYSIVGSSTGVLDFGTVTSPAQITRQLQITNTGGSALTGSLGIINQDASYSINPPSFNLQPNGGTQFIQVTKAALRTGNINDTLRITSNDPANRIIDINVRGRTEATTPRITYSPTALDFGTVTSPTQITRPLQITNMGNGVLTGNVSIINQDTSYSINPLSFSLQPNGGSQTIQITKAALRTGNINDRLRITSNDPVNWTINIPVRGRTVIPPRITYSPTAFQFGDVSSQVTKTLQITNMGGAPLTGDVNIIGPHANYSINPSHFNLQPSGSQFIQFTMAPLSQTTTINDTLRITSNDPTHPTRDINVRGRTIGIKLGLTDANSTPITTINLGTAKLNKIFNLSTNRGGPLRANLSITGDTPFNFVTFLRRRYDYQRNKVLNINAMPNSFTLTCLPSSPAGTYRGTLNITATGAENSPLHIPLECTLLPEPPGLSILENAQIVITNPDRLGPDEPSWMFTQNFETVFPQGRKRIIIPIENVATRADTHLQIELSSRTLFSAQRGGPISPGIIAPFNAQFEDGTTSTVIDGNQTKQLIVEFSANNPDTYFWVLHLDTNDPLFPNGLNIPFVANVIPSSGNVPVRPTGVIIVPVDYDKNNLINKFIYEFNQHYLVAFEAFLMKNSLRDLAAPIKVINFNHWNDLTAQLGTVLDFQDTIGAVFIATHSNPDIISDGNYDPLDLTNASSVYGVFHNLIDHFSESPKITFAGCNIIDDLATPRLHPNINIQTVAEMIANNFGLSRNGVLYVNDNPGAPIIDGPIDFPSSWNNPSTLPIETFDASYNSGYVLIRRNNATTRFRSASMFRSLGGDYRSP